MCKNSRKVLCQKGKAKRDYISRMSDLIPAISLKIRGDQEIPEEGGDTALFQCLGGGSWHFTRRWLERR